MLIDVDVVPDRHQLGCKLLHLSLPDGVNSEVLAHSALAEGIALAPGSLFTRGKEGHHYMRLNLAHTDHPELMERLGRLLQEAGKGPTWPPGGGPLLLK